MVIGFDLVNRLVCFIPSTSNSFPPVCCMTPLSNQENALAQTRLDADPPHPTVGVLQILRTQAKIEICLLL